MANWARSFQVRAFRRTSEGSLIYLVVRGAYVYILYSQKLNKYYVGSSSNPDRRLESEHNVGKSKFTKLGIPWNLMFKQYYPSATIARKVEYRIKQYKSRKIIEKIIAEKVCKIQLTGT